LLICQQRFLFNVFKVFHLFNKKRVFHVLHSWGQLFFTSMVVTMACGQAEA